MIWVWNGRHAGQRRAAAVVSACIGCLCALAFGCDHERDDSDPSVDRAGRGGSRSSPSAGRGAEMPPPVRNPPDAAAVDAGSDAGAPSPALSACEQDACHLRDAYGCSEAETCQLVVARDAVEAQCVARGTHGEGVACTASEDCDRGLDCTSVDSEGTCRRYCCDVYGTAECPAGQACKLALLDGDDHPTGVALCERCDGCDPLAQTGCESERGCYVAPDSEGRACTLCLPRTQDLATGVPCQTADQCAPGHGCFRVDGGNAKCVALCDTAVTDACEASSRCTSLALADTPQLGICARSER